MHRFFHVHRPNSYIRMITNYVSYYIKLTERT
jgi:hypothetical protein